MQRLCATEFGNAFMREFAATDPVGYESYEVSFDLQMQPGNHGGCYKQQMRVTINPRADDAMLTCALVHELRHAMQPDMRFPPVSAENAEKSVLRSRVLEGDAFTFQLLFGLAARAEGDPQYHAANMEFFRQRLPKSAMDELEVACDAYDFSRNAQDRTQALRAMYWCVQEKYMPIKYDLIFADRLQPPATADGYDVSKGIDRVLSPGIDDMAKDFTAQVQALPVCAQSAHGRMRADYMGDAAASAHRIRASLAPALKNTLAQLPTDADRRRVMDGPVTLAPRIPVPS